MKTSDERIWTLYLHTVPKEVRSQPGKKDYFDKYYVGITSRNVIERWGYEGYDYRNQVFGNAIRKYGWNNIQHTIIESCMTHDEACKKEIELIDKLQSTTKMGHGYNVTNGGEGFLGVQRFGEDNPFYGKKHTEETRKKMKEHHYDCSGKNGSFYGHHHTKKNRQLQSERMKQRYIEHPEIFNRTISEERKIQIGIEHSKPVYVFDMDLNYVGEYPNVREAADNLGLSRRVAETIVNGTRKNDKDYIIRFTSDVSSIEDFQNTYVVRKCTPNIYNLYRYEAENIIYQFDKDFNFITEHKNVYEAEKITNIGKDKIDSCCTHSRKQINGFIFEYKRNVPDIEKYKTLRQRIENRLSNKITQYSIDLQVVSEYLSINDACKQTGYTYNSIQKVCDGYKKESNGYVWRYTEVDYNI